ncbi:cyclic nucleotide-gated channel 14 [Actinidia rufa]|uniref:Cyclic nucleotide-gated channel 14 n=1 Tax=Actinidia rufa TaxID=165716 RepID=A0A7J0GBY5_9ERIC|nr:cyclic nucleotide-gated channel 14 [Actinidia rufa]
MGLEINRFYSNGKQNIEHSWEKDHAENLENPSTVYKVSAPLLKPEGGVGEKNRPNGGLRFAGSKVFLETSEPWREIILDPGSELVLQLLNDGKSSCMTSDLNLGIVVTCFRTLADVFYMLHVVIKFRTAYVSPSSRGFGRGELVMDPKMIARRYLKADFFIDAIATLPLPQGWGGGGLRGVTEMGWPEEVASAWERCFL